MSGQIVLVSLDGIFDRPNDDIDFGGSEIDGEGGRAQCVLTLRALNSSGVPSISAL